MTNACHTNDDCLSRSLVEALAEGNLQSVHKILRSGADPNLVLQPEGISAMHMFLQPENYAIGFTIVNQLMKYGGNPNVRSADGLTPVHLCAIWGREDILEALLKYGGDCNLCDAEGNSVLGLALEYGHYDVVDILLNHCDGTNKKKLIPPVDESGASNFHNVGQDSCISSHNEFSFNNAFVDASSSAGSNSSEVWFTVDEYLVIDDEEKKTFHERQWLPHGASSHIFDRDHSDVDYDDSLVSFLTASSTNTLPASLKALPDKIIYEKLNALNANPGPITPGTRRVYLRRLHKLLKAGTSSSQSVSQSKKATYSPELKAFLSGRSTLNLYISLESNFREEFYNPNINDWERSGGVEMSCFTYLLLDPRISDGLSARSAWLTDIDVFAVFIESIFYVGKGKHSRPFIHLYEALDKYGSKTFCKFSSKIQCIMDIWKDGLGVISLPCFHNATAAEAFTREACMIDAIGVGNLTNEQSGTYYGKTKLLSRRDKCRLGCIFLKRALSILLQVGEKQIRPVNLKRNKH